MRESLAARSERDDDAYDVPATVLCALCGQADCAGCTPAAEDASGVVAIIPWERSQASTWSRLWATATATTQGADAFFAVLPDGPMPTAVRFAVLAELLAVAAMAVAIAPIVALALPTLALEVGRNAALRASILKWVALGIPGFALWMVAAHVTHGAALDVGARRQGVPSQRRRAVRFGLYACGWDLMAGPLGLVFALSTKGFRAGLAILDLAMRVPAHASVAFLQGVYDLPAEGVKRARKMGGLAASGAAVASGVVLIAIIVAATLSR